MSPPRRRRRAATAALMACAAAVSACRPNPRNEIGAIAAAGLAEVQRTAPGQSLCVARTIAPWQPATAARRLDPRAPPGFEDLYAGDTFRGGGGLKGEAAGGVKIGGAPGCFDLRGPLILGDRAMLEVHLPGIGQNMWMRRAGAAWRVVMTTVSSYPAWRR